MVKVLLLVAKEASPDVAATGTPSEILADERGGRMPSPPVLCNVAVEPEIVISKVPAEVTTAGGLVDRLEFPIAVTTVGVMIPSRPVDTAVYVAPEIVKFPLPDDSVG